MTTAAAVSYGESYSDAGRIRRGRRMLRLWLIGVLAVLAALVLVGGATRLTDSGLSITQWKPIHGIVPPLSQSEWEEEFALYRQIPEYREINAGMSLAEFKRIYWWEYAHRALARGVGVAFALPLIAFWLAGRIEPGVKPKLVGILALGALQGAVGWWMVASGLAERVDVSQYRLAVHLTMACIIFAAVAVVARGLGSDAAPADARTRRFAGLLVGLALAQIYLGGLVAGLDAGLSYNTWPLMDGALVPGDLLVIDPGWRNLFENPKTVQFAHRTGAYALLAAALWHMVATRRRQPGTPLARGATILFHLLLLQAAIGIATLLTQVHLHLALTHQAMALAVLGYAAAHWRGARGAYPLPTAAAA